MRIGELARATGTKAETIRYYEREGMMPPADRTDSNYRDYSESHKARLQFIRGARELGFSMAEVRELLDFSEDAKAPCAAVDAMARAHIERVNHKIAALTALRDELARVVDSCAHGKIGECQIVEALGARRAG